jgi:hypothetical protein
MTKGQPGKTHGAKDPKELGDSAGKIINILENGGGDLTLLFFSLTGKVTL